MNQFIETSITGERLWWRPHAFAEVCGGYYLLEPIKLDAGKKPAIPQFQTRTDERGVSWDWKRQPWIRVRARIARRQPVNCSPPAEPFFPWADLAHGPQVELEALDINNGPVGAVLLETPAKQAFLASHALVKFAYLGIGCVQINLHEELDFGEIAIKPVVQESASFSPIRAKIERKGSAFIVSELPLHSALLAVVRGSGSNRQLLSYGSYIHEGYKVVKPQPTANVPNDTATQIMEQLLTWYAATSETDNDTEKWLDGWPGHSRAHLPHLVREGTAQGIYDSVRILRENPTGLFRFLALRRLESKALRGQECLPLLATGDFEDAILALLQSKNHPLAQIWSSLTQLEAQCWALRHAQDRCLAEAIQQAASQKPTDLDSALADCLEQTQV